MLFKLLSTGFFVFLLLTSAWAAETDKNVLEDRAMYNDLQSIDDRGNKHTVAAPSPIIFPPPDSLKPKQKKISNKLKPRVEFNHRYSNDRAITMGEFWVPLVQNEVDGSVLFGDVRVMGDNNANDEYNAGVGYREVVDSKLLGEGVAGGMVWLDRRHTARGSKFNQITTGLEWLGKQYDVRLNGYVPLNSRKSHTQTNPNRTGAGFVGNQILVNTDQSVVEEALSGLDLEFGTRINFLDGITDSTRIYAGGYHFQGDRAENVTGWRTRISSDIASDIQFGARYQHDDIRGSQTYLEATIRFPFKSKKSFKEEGLRSRLDESPERDIDIVTNEIVTDQGLNEALVNVTSSTVQNVIHVDNTAAGGGDGSIETPYNTLANAEAVATTHDLVYVHRGDGTTTGQQDGITLDDRGQMLVGAGTNLVYDSSRFSTSNGQNISGVIIPSDPLGNPVITNGAGSGVTIAADDVFVSGITVDSASTHGISAVNNVGVTWDKVNISNILTTNNTQNGVFVHSTSAVSPITDLNLDQITAMGNTGQGVELFSSGGGKIENATIENVNVQNNNSIGLEIISNGNGSIITNIEANKIMATGNGAEGVSVRATSDAKIEDMSFENTTATGNTRYGFLTEANGGVANINNVSYTKNVSNANGFHGYFSRVQNNGSMGTISYKENTASNNVQNGYRVQVNGAGGTITTTNFIDNIADSNGTEGAMFHASFGGNLGTANINNNVANNNTNQGVFIQANGVGSSITTANVNNNVANNNTLDGFRVYANGVGSTLMTTLSTNTADNNGQAGFRLFSSLGGAIGQADFLNNTATNNANEGFYAISVNAGSDLITNYTNNIADNNNHYGFFALAQAGGGISQGDFTRNTATNNMLSGFFLQSNGAGSTGVANYVDNVANNNLRNGYWVNAVNDSSITQLSYEDNTSTNNIFYGINIDDESVAGSIGIDLGGGAFGGAGGNRLFGNTLQDLLVDLDGAELKAQNNWWGTSSGLLPAEVLLHDASTVDSSLFLIEDPG